MTFTWFSTDLELFDHPYNTTLLNERAVEIPVALAWLDGRDLAAAGVEVGAVLGHYGITGHRVVDLYEPGDGIENIDVFDLDGTFDWIVSISTLEHIPNAVDALYHLRSLVAPGGSMLVTVGAGQHADLDAYLSTGAGSKWCTTLVRSGGTWCRTTDLQFLPYAFSSKWAESVWIGEFRWQRASRSN